MVSELPFNHQKQDLGDDDKILWILLKVKFVLVSIFPE